MKHKILFLFAALLSLTATATEFQYSYEGQTLWYTVLDSEAKTVEVRAGNEESPGSEVIGNLIIPADVKYGDTAYSVVSIGAYALSTSAINSVRIPNSVTTIGDAAFYACIGLTSVVIPGSVNSIGKSPFSRCRKLRSIIVSESNPNYVDINGILYDKDITTLIQAPGDIKSIEIPNSVKTIDYQAFIYCTGLKSVAIPNSVTTINDFAFSETGLKSVVIPGSVTTIGAGAFKYCFNLTSFDIPNSVTCIGPAAFSGCHELESINVSESNPNYADIDGVLFNKDITTLIQVPGGITSVNIPNSVSTIDYESFGGCIYIASVVIPNSVTTIGYGAFSQCSALTSIAIHDSVNIIGERAFFQCEALTDVIYNTEAPTTANSNIFSELTYQNATLHIPAGTEDAFRSVEPWNLFSTIFVDESLTGIEGVLSGSNPELDFSAHYDVYNLNGAWLGNSVDKLAGGIYIVRQGNIVIKIAMK